MRRGARSLHYLGLKSTYDGCWGAKAPIITIPFHLKSTFDSPECTYHDAMSCSTWVELPGIGAHTNPSIMMTPALLSFGHLLKVFQRRWSVPSLHSWLEEIFCPFVVFCCHTCSPSFLVEYRDRAADNWTWRRFNDNDDNAPLAMT